MNLRASPSGASRRTAALTGTCRTLATTCGRYLVGVRRLRRGEHRLHRYRRHRPRGHGIRSAGLRGDAGQDRGAHNMGSACLADLGQGPDIAPGTGVHENHQGSARARGPRGVVTAAGRATGAGGARLRGGRARMSLDMLMRETTQRVDVLGTRRHPASRGAAHHASRAVGVSSEVDGPGSADQP